MVSIVLIISAMFVRQQNRFMQKYSLGFDKDQVVVVELNGNIMRNHKDSYVGGLKEYPGIEDVAFCRQKFGSEDSYRTWSGIYIGEVDKAYDLNNDGVNDVCVTDKAGSRSEEHTSELQSHA